MLKPLPYVVAALVLASPVYAQDRIAEVDKIFAFATAETPGCAVGVSQQGKVVLNKGYGLAHLEQKRTLGPTSLFDIGSTQKQFAAAAILLLVEQGRLSLTDDVRKHIPELPDYGRVITVDHLLTHTSGIRDWPGLLPFAPEGTDVMTLIMRQRGLNFLPGEQWSYSTSGFELAKEIVARVSGTSFAEFTKKRLFEPLGMSSSAYVQDIMQSGPNAAMGYRKEASSWTPFMRLGTNRGGGTIATTIGDILTWNDALATGKLGKFVTAKLQEPFTLRNGRTLQYARGLMLDSAAHGPTVFHSGGAAGFSTWMGRMPAHGLAVTVACNFDPVSATALAGRVAEVFLPPADPSWKRPGPVAVEGVDVSGRAGLYFDERTGDPMRLGASNGRLSIANGPALVPVSASSFRPARADLFFRSQDAFEMTFPDADHLEIRSMEGQVTRYRRAQPWTPSAADLQAADGRYESKELGATYEIVAGTNAITMRMEGAPQRSLELTPVERDAYMVRMVIARFRRDASGRVTGFDFSNPVVQHIAFTRLGDRAGATSDALIPVTKTPAAAATSPATLRLESFVGEYELAPGRTVTITLENGQLHGEPTGNPKRPLVHASGSTFHVGGPNAPPITVTFAVGADGRATGLVMSQNGEDRTLRKIR